MCGEVGDGDSDGVGKGLGIGEIGGRQDGVEDCGLHGDVEGASGRNPVHDFKRGDPPK